MLTAWKRYRFRTAYKKILLKAHDISRKNRAYNEMKVELWKAAKRRQDVKNFPAKIAKLKEDVEAQKRLFSEMGDRLDHAPSNLQFDQHIYTASRDDEIEGIYKTYISFLREKVMMVRDECKKLAKICEEEQELLEEGNIHGFLEEFEKERRCYKEIREVLKKANKEIDGIYEKMKKTIGTAPFKKARGHLVYFPAVMISIVITIVYLAFEKNDIDILIFSALSIGAIALLEDMLSGSKKFNHIYKNICVEIHRLDDMNRYLP